MTSYWTRWNRRVAYATGRASPRQKAAVIRHMNRKEASMFFKSYRIELYMKAGGRKRQEAAEDRFMDDLFGEDT